MEELMVKLEGKRPHTRPKHKQHNNVKKYLKHVRRESVKLIPLAQDREYFRALRRKVMKLPGSIKYMKLLDCL